MRVYHVVRQFWPSVGGLEDVVMHLAREQMRRGADVKIVTLDRIFAAPERRLAAQDHYDGLNILRLPYAGSSRYPIAPRILRAVGEADLIHVHAIDFFFDFLALTRPLHNKPLLATTHGGFFHTRAHARLKRIWFHTITRCSLSAYDALIACSQADYDLFAPLAKGNLNRIDNGADIGKFAGHSSETSVKQLVTIGRFSENKRLDRLLDTMVHLRAMDETWHFTLIGAPSDWSLARLKSEVALRHLDKHVTLAPEANNTDAASLFAKASLFVSASEHEGFGLAPIEALSAGLIPILHDNAAFRALKGRCDLVEIIDFSDAAGAASAINHIWSEGQSDYAARRLKAQAAARDFAWPHVADLYLALYEKIFSQQSRFESTWA